MSQEDFNFAISSLSETERELIRSHRDRVVDAGLHAELRVKILKAAHDFHVWLVRNPEWSCDEHVFFSRFGYADDDAGQGRIVFRGVAQIHEVINHIRF